MELFHNKMTCAVFKYFRVHSQVKSLSALRYFPTHLYFIYNHLFSKHSPEVISF